MSTSPARLAVFRRLASLQLATALAACSGTVGEVRLAGELARAGTAADSSGATTAMAGMAGMGGTSIAEGGEPGGTMAGMDPNMSMGPNMPAPNPCGIATAAGICFGNVQRRCVQGAIVEADCAQAGQACAIDASGSAQCVTQAPTAVLASFDVAGAPVNVEVHGTQLSGAALVYTVRIADRAYQISCQAAGSGRSCTALSAGQALLTVTFTPASGLNVAAPGGALGGAYGPTVLRAADLALVSDPAAFVLLDRNVLNNLPQPTDAGAAAAYITLLRGAAYTTWDTVRFRLDLNALSSAQRTALASLIGSHVDTSPAGNAFVAEHMLICHVQGWLTPGGSYGGTSYAYGGFTNGHRTYLAEMESFVVAESSTCPFRRLPVFDPAGSIPPEMMAGVANAQIGLPLPANFAPRSPGLQAFVSAPAFPDPNPEAGDNNFGLALNDWHNAVHTAGGGLFGVVMTASRAPVFFCWHTGLDVLWDGFRLMTQLQ